MAKGLDPEYLQQLKSKNDLVEVVGAYVPLERKGGNWWGRCPFHHEKTPSFTVNAEGQFYHCFGCGVSGDVITFIREIESVDFMDAVKILADRAKMPLPEMNFDTEKTAEQKRRRDAVLQILRTAAHFYLDNLNSGRADAHVQYILDRKIAAPVVRKFGLGASLDFHSLPQFLLDKGFRRDDILESGAVTISEKNGRLVDAQAGRLIFPVINAFGDVIAFGGRVLGKTDFAKYKNTRETIVFNKSKTLYNINLVKKLKKASGLKDLIVVEGYMDTLSLFQAGFRNVVASMGTALTKDQARLAKRYADSVYISYDGDFAGQKGAIRGLEILRDEQINVRVVPLPEGLDPDDVIKRQGSEGYQKCLDAAMPLIDFKLEVARRKYDLTKTEERRSYIAEALKIIREADSESLKEELLKQLRDRTGVTYESLRRDLDSESAPAPRTEIAASSALQGDPAMQGDGADRLTRACRFVLAAVLFGARYAKNFDISGVRFTDPVHNTIAEYIKEKQKKGEPVRASALFDLFDENEPELNEILDLSVGDAMQGENGARYFEACIRSLECARLTEELDRLSALCDAETDLAKKKEMTRRILQLTIQLKQFN